MTELICDADGIRLSPDVVLAERRGATIVPREAHEIFRRLAPDFGADLDWARLNGVVGRAARLLTEGRIEAARKAVASLWLPQPLAKHNPNHYGPGPRGGQFAPAQYGSDDGADETSPASPDVANRYREQLAGSVITGLTRHGLNQAINRGISPADMLDAVTNPIQILPQPNGTVRYVGRNATVVLNPGGRVVTAW